MNIMEYLCQGFVSSFASQLKTRLKAKGRSIISACDKMKTQSCDFTKSGSFPENAAKVMITK